MEAEDVAVEAKNTAVMDTTTDEEADMEEEEDVTVVAVETVVAAFAK